MPGLNEEDEIDFTPIMWLCSCIDISRGQGFKVTKQGDDFIEVLHKETGAVWRFDVKTLREPVT